MDTPEGDPRLVEIVCQEMNVPVDPTAEETKGGSGHVAKMLLSASDAQLALVRSCCLPASWHSCRSRLEFESRMTSGSSSGSMQKQRKSTVLEAICYFEACKNIVKIARFPKNPDGDLTKIE